MSRSLHRPTPAQIAAADPRSSAWVGANAGSGKTRVLTQRVARLLLDGAEPEKILCLTYTKAAAAEMQNRLFDMLGDWAMAPDDWLASQLAALEGREPGPVDPQALARARRLFARALETPGGLRIQTIHAFCDALLRRFPLEAGVSPRFEVLDDRQAALMQDRVRTEMAIDAEHGRDTAFDRIAERLNEDHLNGLIAAIHAERAGFADGDLDRALDARFGADARRAPEEIATDALSRLHLDELARLAEALAEKGGKADQTCATTLGTIADLARTDPLMAAENLSLAYLTKEGTPRSRKTFPVKAVIEACPWADELTDSLIAWAVDTRARFKTIRTVARARDLHAFAGALLSRYDAAKRARGLLDFDDLIDRAHDLLVRSDMAVWTLWKLDQGIDHVLVDEAQDTAPRQWALIEAIAAEFHAGEGAHDGRRTLFVVGDEKQSIYSFQGAEPAAFGTTRDRLGQWLEGMGRELARPALSTSFRSAPGILRFVDAVFEGEAAAGLTVTSDPVIHEAHRSRDAARVDLWPLVTPPERPDPPEWWQPVDRPPPDDPRERLAGILAGEIARMIGTDRLPPRDGRPGRLVRPGDILVLVTRRDRLAHGLIRRLKSLGVPVAGADRLSLTAELAVKDLMAAVRVAVTRDDDLSLAALLRSPLCGLSEEELFRLAHGRKGTLWQALRKSGHAATVMLDDLAARADYLRPYEFLERILVHHDGRPRLVARLGLEAEDPIDELLAQALSFEARQVPSLAGFIDWIEAGEIEVKREMEAGLDAVRVMTVHGAKGLEAPVVILPDTMSGPNRGGGRPRLHTVPASGNAPPLVLWSRSKALDDPVTAEAREEADRREDDERKRLLYVALTRAEDWLILCGASGREKTEGRWYGFVSAGMERLGSAVPCDGPEGLDSAVLRYEDHPVPLAGAAAAEAERESEAASDLPSWLSPALTESRPRRLRPSGLVEHEAAGGAGLGRETALAHGSAVHRLLEELPGRAPEERTALARRLIAAEFPAMPSDRADAALAEGLAVLSAPFSVRVFGAGSRAEAGIALPSPDGGPAMIGRIDRLVVAPEEVLVVDFKTDAAVPEAARSAPAGYVAQLAAYCRGVAALYPARTVRAAILWTAGPELMLLPPDLLETAGNAWSGSLDMAEAGT